MTTRCRASTTTTASGVSLQPVSGWQGIRDGVHARPVPHRRDVERQRAALRGADLRRRRDELRGRLPGATTTSVYGPEHARPTATLQLVGSYKTGAGVVNGFLFQGTTADLSNPADYTTIDYPGATYTYVHSTMGGLAVGNADGPEGNAPIGTGHAFVYDIATGTSSRTSSTRARRAPRPTASGTTAARATRSSAATRIPASRRAGAGHGYMVDYDSRPGSSRTGRRSTTPNGAAGQDFVTHFEGISSDEKGVYTLAADSVQIGIGRLRAGLVGDRPAQHRRLVRDPAVGQPERPDRRRPEPASPATTRWPATRSSASSSPTRAGILLPGDGQHRLPALERHQRQRRQRHRDLRRLDQPDRDEQHRHRRQRHARAAATQATASSSRATRSGT